LKTSRLFLLSCGRSVEDAAFVGGNHVLDVDKGIFATVGLEHFKRVLNQVAHVESLSLGVVNLVAEVGIALLEKVHNGQNLSVVGHKSFSDSVTAGDECLQDLESNCNDFRVACVKGG